MAYQEQTRNSEQILSGQKEGVFDQPRKLKMNVVSFEETRKRGTGNDAEGNYVYSCTGVDKARRANFGAPVIMHERAKNAYIKNACKKRIKKI